jgi:hypothetical protein
MIDETNEKDESCGKIRRPYTTPSKVGIEFNRNTSAGALAGSDAPYLYKPGS